MAKVITLCLIVLAACVFLVRKKRKIREHGKIFKRLMPWAESLKDMNEGELRDEYRKICRQMLETKELQDELDVRFEIINKEQNARLGRSSVRKKSFQFEKDWRKLSI